MSDSDHEIAAEILLSATDAATAALLSAVKGVSPQWRSLMVLMAAAQVYKFALKATLETGRWEEAHLLAHDEEVQPLVDELRRRAKHAAA